MGPSEGDFVEVENGRLRVPNEPVIAFIEGDGIGEEVIGVARRVTERAVELAYPSRRIVWWELLAGKKALKTGSLLPEETVKGIALAKVALKGPLETPVGSGHRSLNVTLRKALDLYANVRPVQYYGTPSPLKRPEDVDLVIFRENTEDVYAGIEWKAGSEEAERFRELLRKEFGVELRADAGVGVKPISESGSKRIMRRALGWAVERERKRVTIMHKGNIMKFTEGAFREWCYEVAREEFGEKVSIGRPEPGKILVDDKIADNLFQQIILRPGEYDVIVTPNLNGDYISDAAAALVGGLGLAAGLNLGDTIALAEPVHGTAPDIAGKGIANPSAAILSAALLLDYMGWDRAAELMRTGVKLAIVSGKRTPDLGGSLSTAEFGEAVMEAMEDVH